MAMAASIAHMKNRQAFYNHSIIPKQLVDTNLRDTTATLFGHRCAAPIGQKSSFLPTQGGQKYIMSIFD